MQFIEATPEFSGDRMLISIAQITFIEQVEVDVKDAHGNKRGTAICGKITVAGLEGHYYISCNTYAQLSGALANAHS